MARRKTNSAVTVRSLETGEVIRVEKRKTKQRSPHARSKRAQRVRIHAALNRDWASAVERDE